MNEHLFHLLLIAVPLGVSFAIVIWNSNFKFSFLRTLSLFVLICFLVLHVAPDRLTHSAFAHSGHGNSIYPCCNPQISETPKIAVVPVSLSYVQMLPTKQLQKNPFVFILSNDPRAPPVFS